MRTFVLIAVTLVLTTGCSKPEFKHRAGFNDLEDFAQEYVSAAIEKYYGDLNNIVAYDGLKLQSNKATGFVQAASNESDKTKIVFTLEEPHSFITAGTEVFWVNGELAGTESGWISEWDSKTSTATLKTRLEKLPIDGTQVILGPGQVLTEGRRIYAVHCQHCHGLNGDGNGPTAEYLNPKPRDYTKGVFKYTLTQATERASRDDLKRILEEGMPGTYMPSFKLLSPDEMNSVVEYVLYLSMRGETEYQVVRQLASDYSKEAVKERVQDGLKAKADGDEDYETLASIREEFYQRANDPDDLQDELTSTIELMASRWERAQGQNAKIVPKEKWVGNDPASVERGRKLYLSIDLNCFACHGDAGFGDGPQQFMITKDIETGKDNAKPGLYDTWGEPTPPRNLHTGIYRGGRRPIDLYARVHSGIKGTTMPAFGSKLSDQEIWDIVNYLYSIPYESTKAGAGSSENAVPETAGLSASLK